MIGYPLERNGQKGLAGTKPVARWFGGPHVKPKKRSRTHIARDASRSVRADDGERAVVLDFVLYRIEAFIRRQGGGVTVRHDRMGYTLFGEETGAPFARLRPKVAKYRYEVLYWSRETKRWRSASPYPGTDLPLDDALEFVAADPMDCFWT
jgi:hypothetical protein